MTFAKPTGLFVALAFLATASCEPGSRAAGGGGGPSSPSTASEASMEPGSGSGLVDVRRGASGRDALAVLVIRSITAGEEQALRGPIALSVGTENQLWTEGDPIRFERELQPGEQRTLDLMVSGSEIGVRYLEYTLLAGRADTISLALDPTNEQKDGRIIGIPAVIPEPETAKPISAPPASTEEDEPAEPEPPESAPEQQPEDESEEYRPAAFRSSPPGATVVVTDYRSGREITEGVTPFEASLPPGLYSWSMELGGHLTERSDDPLDLSGPEAPPDVRIDLIDIRGGDPKASGDEAFESERWREAIDFYRLVGMPSGASGPAAEARYVEAQLNLGQSVLQLPEAERNYSEAIQAFQNILRLRPREEMAVLGLAWTYYYAGQYRTARDQASRIENEFFNFIAPENRRRVFAEADYLIALSAYEMVGATAGGREGSAQMQATRVFALRSVRDFLQRYSDLTEEYPRVAEWIEHARGLEADLVGR